MNSIKNSRLIEKFKEKGPLRFVFQNFLTFLFIIMIYFYFSEIFGSISTIYITNNSFTIQFGITLVIFTLLAKFFGVFHGLIGGIIGELVYQIAILDAVYFEWCFIIGFYGFLCGFYKYKPLKYQNNQKSFITLISLILAGILSSVFIIILIYVLNFNILDPYTIFVAYGFQFFIQTIFFTIFIVPIILFIYDKYLAVNERQIYTEILTHHPLSEEGVTHTFFLKFGRTKIFFCSRCSGLFIGFISAFFFTHLLELIYKSQFSPELAILLCIILPLPGLVDWSVQAIRIRSSDTKRRLMTGFLIGFALHMMAYTRIYYIYLLLILLLYFSIFFIFVYLKQKKARIAFEKEMDSLPSEDDEVLQ